MTEYFFPEDIDQPNRESFEAGILELAEGWLTTDFK